MQPSTTPDLKQLRPSEIPVQDISAYFPALQLYKLGPASETTGFQINREYEHTLIKWNTFLPHLPMESDAAVLKGWLEEFSKDSWPIDSGALGNMFPLCARLAEVDIAAALPWLERAILNLSTPQNKFLALSMSGRLESLAEAGLFRESAREEWIEKLYLQTLPKPATPEESARTTLAGALLAAWFCSTDDSTENAARFQALLKQGSESFDVKFRPYFLHSFATSLERRIPPEFDVQQSHRLELLRACLAEPGASRWENTRFHGQRGSENTGV